MGSKQGELLHFTVRRTEQQKALARFGDRPTAPMGSVLPGQPPPQSVQEYLRRNTTDRATFRRISSNAGKRLVDRVRNRVWDLDLIDTKLFVTSWTTTLVDSSDTGLTADIRLGNEAPYALYVHPKKTPPSMTFVNRWLPLIVTDVMEELAEDQAAFMGTIGARVVADVARGAIMDAVARGRNG